MPQEQEIIHNASSCRYDILENALRAVVPEWLLLQLSFLQVALPGE